MKTINEDIKNGTFKQVYLLYGAESYLRNFYRKRLCDAAVPPEDTMNRGVFSGDAVKESEIIDLAETMPFFSERRLISLTDTGLFKNAAELLPDYIRKLPDYLILVFNESEVDKRSRMFKAVREAGYAAEFADQDEKTLSEWTARLLSKAGLKISQSDMHLFLSRTGPRMGNISLEADKLINYCAGQTSISKADIEAITGDRVENRIFDMISAITAHNRKKALDLYADLLALKEPPMKILILIARQYNQLLLIKELQEEGNNAILIQKKTGIQNFIVRKCMEATRGYTKRELEDNVRFCVRAEEDVKSGRLSDHLSVELVISEFS